MENKQSEIADHNDGVRDYAELGDQVEIKERITNKIDVMKLKITLLIFFVFYTFSVFAQSRSPIRTQLVEQYKKYIGKEVYNFLLDDSVRKYEDIHFSEEPPGVFSYIKVYLYDSLRVRVYLKDMPYEEQFDTTSSWNSEVLFKKKISRIIFNINDLDELTIADIK